MSIEAEGRSTVSLGRTRNSTLAVKSEVRERMVEVSNWRAWVDDRPIPAIGREIFFLRTINDWDKASVMKQHSLPESKRALAACFTPLSSIRITTAVARRTLLLLFPVEAWLVGSMADADTVGVEDCSAEFDGE